MRKAKDPSPRDAYVLTEQSGEPRHRQGLERSLALLEKLYTGAPVGLGFIDTDARYRRVNEHLAAISGLTVAEHVGRTLSDVLGAMAERLLPFYRRALEQRALVKFEASGEPPTDPGVVHHWHISLTPVEIDGSLLGVSCVVHDITERKRLEMRAAFLARAGEMLDSSLDYRGTLRSVARLAVPEIADWCSISMLNERGEVYRLAIAHRDPAKDALAQELIEREALPRAAPAGAASVMETAETQLIEEFSDELLDQSMNDPRSREITRALGIRSSISVPLIARGRTLGAISLVGETRSRFAAEDVQLAEDLARRAAVNIDNARLYTEHSRIARTLQAGLLPPSLPGIPGLELVARYRPAGELNQVGGDFYDTYLRAPEEWLVVLGDVTGKGAEAAATTALVRYTLRAAAMHPGPPSHLLAELNKAMLAQRAAFCTIALVAIRSSGTEPIAATVCLGGHAPPLLLDGDGSMTTVGEPGTLLGYVPDAIFVETSITLTREQTLLLFTDGLTEAAAPRGWSDAQLRERIAACPTDDLDAMLASLEASAIADADGHPRDDIALLALRPSR
jgi:PAS domain S-box-containing protein